MKVTVLGATGGTGQWVIKLLLKEGHEVTAYVRNPEKIEDKSEGLKVIKGEIFDIEHLGQSLLDQEVLISCLGSNTTKKSTQLREMATAVLKATEKTEVKHIIYMATAGIDDEFTGPFKWFIRLILGNVMDDHKAAANLYRNSGIDYTIIKPMQLKDNDLTGKYVSSLDGLPSSRKAISRANVADCMVKAMTTEGFINQSVVLAE